MTIFKNDKLIEAALLDNHNSAVCTVDSLNRRKYIILNFLAIVFLLVSGNRAAED